MASIFKNIIIALLIGCVLFIKPTPTFAQSKENAQTFNLHVTHSLFSAFLYSYFNEGDEKVRMQYMANKQYLLTFLNTWEALIDTGKFQSSEEIFRFIRAQNGYLNKYYYVWVVLLYGSVVNLGEMRNGGLKAILLSEQEKNLDKRIISILETVNITVLSNSNDYVLATAIAQPFKNVKNEEIRRLSNHILTSLPFHKTVQGLALIKDLIIPGGLVLGAATKTYKIQKIINAGAKLRVALTGVKIRSATAIAKMAKNPFLKKVNPIHITMAGSVGAHAGLLFYGYHANAKDEEIE